MPREVILDTQGRVVETYLQSQGFQIQNCRVGKFIELDLKTENKSEVEIEVKKMLANGLYNPLTENYEIVDV